MLLCHFLNKLANNLSKHCILTCHCLILLNESQNCVIVRSVVCCLIYFKQKKTAPKNPIKHKVRHQRQVLIEVEFHVKTHCATLTDRATITTTTTTHQPLEEHKLPGRFARPPGMKPLFVIIQQKEEQTFKSSSHIKGIT